WRWGSSNASPPRASCPSSRPLSAGSRSRASRRSARATGRGRREGPAGAGPSRSARRSGLPVEGVLDVVAGLLEVGLRLVGLPLGLEALVVRGLARALLELAARLLGGVLGLVSESHGCSSRRYRPTVGRGPPARTPSAATRVVGCAGAARHHPGRLRRPPRT